ncbi:MAG: lipopolysaccharide biosynthesis protein [Enterococcus italicus]|uniref:lipopolysaccharide biosynthesis protein n=1 Tax=Enterococcus italicus TaxID=246144 RepID=UPI003992FF59
MKKRTSDFLKSFSYTFSSNLVSLIVSTLVILLVPKLIGVKEYGYWQLYLFYTSYVGFMHFGWIDGIYLRYGGDMYEDLDKKVFYSQFIQLVIIQIVLAFLILIFSLFTVTDRNKEFIIIVVSLAMILLNLRTFFLFIMQATNRIKEYAQVIMLDRIIYIILILLFLGIGFRNFKILIIADIFGKILTLFLSMYYCKEISYRKINDYFMTINETICNINVGIKLMFANIASTLLIGVIRLAIETNWNVATFGKISLTLSISSMMMTFINAVGVIMFPLLRRTEKSKLDDIYSSIRDSLMAFLLLSLLIYYPLKAVMVIWLPNYAESLVFMAFVFPMFVYEGKMALLINTYLKTLRYENAMMKINLISLGLCLIITFFSARVFNSLDITVLNIIIVLFIRTALAESFLAGKLKIHIIKDMLLEGTLTVIFIISGWFIDSWNSLTIYLLAYIFYLILKKKELNQSFNKIKFVIKNNEIG